MKIAFTTLGCPDWDLETACSRGKEYGFDGVDFRGIKDEIDITKLPAFTTSIKETRKMIEDTGLSVSCISSSIRLCELEKREEYLEEAKRTIQVARELGSPNIRVFGQGNHKQQTKEEMAKTGRECMEEILELDGADKIQWLFETHDHWIKAADCRLILDGIPNPNLGALWDVGHTSRVGGETPQQSWTELKDRAGYIHLKDALHDTSHPQAMKDGWRYVIPGEGQLPLTEAISLLKENGYSGWLLFEHEKRWHPDLLEPEEIFPLFVDWIRPQLS